MGETAGARAAGDPELAEQWRAALGDWPGPCEAWRVLGSTNDRAREQARAGAPPWTAVLAREQAGGRGRGGRCWESLGGNLHLSVLLPGPGESPGLLPLACGVAVAECLAGWGVAAEVKWPNDVLARGRKLAGVLVEAGSTSGRIQDVVAGVGVNLERVPTLSAESAQPATSVRALVGRAPSLAEAAADLLRALAAWHARLLAEPGAVAAAWREKSVPWWGETVEVRSAGLGLRGRLAGLDADGALVLELPGGARERVTAGEMLRLGGA